MCHPDTNPSGVHTRSGRVCEPPLSVRNPLASAIYTKRPALRLFSLERGLHLYHPDTNPSGVHTRSGRVCEPPLSVRNPLASAIYTKRPALRAFLCKWSGREDSNLRPPQPHCGALPGCATPRKIKKKSTEPVGLCFPVEIVYQDSI